MNKKLPQTTEQFLRSYSALAEYWEDGSGDTHEILSLRELLADLLPTLTVNQRNELERIDHHVLLLSKEAPKTGSWDVVMLQKTADLIHKNQDLRQAA